VTMLNVSRDYRLLYNMVLNRFSYEDDTTLIDWDVVESWIIDYGMVGFYQDELGLLAYIAEPYSYQTGYNGLPSQYTLYNPTMSATRFTVDAMNPNLFIIKDTIMGDSWRKIIMEYAEDLHDLRAVRKSNLNVMKTPVVIKTTQDNLANAQALFAQYQEATVPIFEDNDDLLGNETLKAIDLNVSDIRLEKLGIERERLINEFASLLGYSALTNQKRERMLVDEISQGSAITEAGAIQAFKNREKACEWANSFGYDVVLKPIVDIETEEPEPVDGGDEEQTQQQSTEKQKEGDGDNGSIM